MPKQIYKAKTKHMVTTLKSQPATPPARQTTRLLLPGLYMATFVFASKSVAGCLDFQLKFLYACSKCLQLCLQPNFTL